MSLATREHETHIPEPRIARFLFADTRMAPVWLILRLWLGYQWIQAAWGKWAEGGWVGKGAGEAVKGFAQGAIAQTTGEHPQVTGWYADFLENVVELPHAGRQRYFFRLAGGHQASIELADHRGVVAGGAQGGHLEGPHPRAAAPHRAYPARMVARSPG
jgi:hypothetical protein